jgi:hypothetical protein
MAKEEERRTIFLYASDLNFDIYCFDVHFRPRSHIGFVCFEKSSTPSIHACFLLVRRKKKCIVRL